MRGLFCLRHAPRNPTSTTRFIRPTSSCSAANQPVCRRRCTTLPMRGSSFRCRRACARSMSRWLLRWQRAKHCGSCGNVAWVERKGETQGLLPDFATAQSGLRIRQSKQHEASEGHSHAPRRYPSPASLAGAGRLEPVCQIPQANGGDITLPDPPHPQGSPKEWQNIASRVEFLVCPHEIKSARSGRAKLLAQDCLLP